MKKGKTKSFIAFIMTAVICICILPMDISAASAEEVESIEVLGSIPTLIEDADGFTADRYNDETGEFEAYIRYRVNVDNLLLKINYIDGTSETAKLWESPNGYPIFCDDHQFERDLTVDGNNWCTISYLGYEVNVPITVVPTPIDSIVINSAPTREYTYGEFLYGGIGESGYYFYPRDISGLSVTVKYNDGTSETYKDSDFKDDGTLNGYDYSIEVDTEPCTEAGEIPVTLSYMGKTATYNVTLKESPVSKIEVTKDPYNAVETSNLAPNFYGMQFKVEYKDGSSELVTVTEDNLSYGYNGQLFYCVHCSRGDIYLWNAFGDVAMRGYAINYLGAETKYEMPYEEDTREVVSATASNVTWNGLGMTIRLQYADGTSESFKISDAVFANESVGNGCIAFAIADNGLRGYEISSDKNNGKIEKYYICIYGYTVIEVTTPEPGDISGSDGITMKDLTLVRRALAGWKLDGLEMSAADVNGDGEVTMKDVTILNRYLAGWDVTLG